MGPLKQLPDPSTEMSWSFRLPSTLVMPLTWYKASETDLIHPSQDKGTANRVCQAGEQVISGREKNN